MLRFWRLLLVTALPTLLARRRRGPLRPSWSFLFEWSIRMLRRDWEETAAWPLEAQRAAVDARPAPAPHLRRVQRRDELRGGVPVRRFLPPAAGPARVVFFHGGSYVYGSTRTSHGELCAALACATGLEVVGVEYRLAPEHPWPAQLDDALAACRALDGPLLLVGDSAGGHLAVTTALRLARRPLGLALLSPWVDLEMPGASWEENDPWDFGTRAVLRRHAQAVAGARPLAELALAGERLAELPPTLVSVGGVETPRDDILQFARRLEALGVALRLHVAEDMPHDPLLFAGHHPSATAALEAVAAFLRERAGAR